jgi:hypothetical protein
MVFNGTVLLFVVKECWHRTSKANRALFKNLLKFSFKPGSKRPWFSQALKIGPSRKWQFTPSSRR